MTDSDGATATVAHALTVIEELPAAVYGRRVPGLRGGGGHRIRGISRPG